MTTDRPSFEEFSTWALHNLQFDPTERAFKSWVEINVRTFKTFVESHIFFTNLQKLIERHQATPKHKEINIVTRSIDLNTKSFESIISKIYRLNVVENNRFPSPKNENWVVGDNIFRELKDIVRTTIVCRHINEPAKITNLIAEICTSLSLRYKINAQAKEHGYYAYHIYIFFDIELINRNWESITESACLEIQVTTEMQYMLYALTHVFYEAEREKIAANSTD